MVQAFDMLSAARTLHDASMDREHAEAVASVIQQRQGELVTRTDLRAEIAGLRAEIADFRAELVRMERRIMMFALVLAGALFAALRYL
ncbi:MAG: hypothetical protein OXF26_10525 [Alphaproteobacteria bacterium]|nr:hypothetical protein [Alphaproteobacteria bacterium]MCY4319989.1 hypothetical protein [Alphaproteobacteria bacterium]